MPTIFSEVSPEWRAKIGEGSIVEWPIGYRAKGDDGVAALIVQLGNAISHIEYAYAVKNNLALGLVRNSAGRFISPATKSFQKAADRADWTGSRDFYLIMTNSAEDDPIRSPQNPSY